MLGVNNGRSTDLASYLKTKDVTLAELRVGDIVVDCHNVWHVTGIKEEKDGIRICEQDGNDTIYPWANGVHPQRAIFTIIDPRALDAPRKRAVKNGTKCDYLEL